MNKTAQEQRLRAIEDRFAILDLEADYTCAWDMGEPRAWAELFTQDGVFEMQAAGSMPGVRLVGREALETFCRDVGRTWVGLHYMHPPRLRLAGDEADSVIFFEFRHIQRDAEALVRQGVTAGYYRTRYRRTGDGWRIQERIEQAVADDLRINYPAGLGPLTS